MSSTSPVEGTTLLIIDPQKDFHPGGSLAVTNADEDAKRIANLIRASIYDTSEGISRIVITMDTHHKIDIAHPGFWVSEEGNHPDPFTLISYNDVESGKWRPSKDVKFHKDATPKFIDEAKVSETLGMEESEIYDDDGNVKVYEYCLKYIKKLEETGRLKHCIWPEHCLIGTDGHKVVDVIIKAIDEWSKKTNGKAEYVEKGQNPLAEMYSGIQAEVEICPRTSKNEELLESLKKSDKILVCGEALSHCVNHTVRHLIQDMSDEERKKVCLLENCASAVASFENDATDFVNHLKEQGCQVLASDTFFINGQVRSGENNTCGCIL